MLTLWCVARLSKTQKAPSKLRTVFGIIGMSCPCSMFSPATGKGPRLGLTIVCVYFSRMTESHSLFGILRQSADADCVTAIERLVADASDHQLSRINVLAFARRHGLDEEKAIASFLHAARIGLFELSWNVLCPGCGGVLDASATLKSVRRGLPLRVVRRRIRPDARRNGRGDIHGQPARSADRST